MIRTGGYRIMGGGRTVEESRGWSHFEYRVGYEHRVHFGCTDC